MSEDRLEAMRLELRRGSLALIVLTALRHEHYGYSLRQKLQADGLAIEEGTLYPLVRRLESHGLLESRWSDEQGSRLRYYRMSVDGQKVLNALKQEWQTLNKVMHTVQESSS